MTIPRLAVLADLREENWKSMDLFAEMLVRELQAGFSSVVEATGITPSFTRRFTRFPILGRKRTAHNADILLSRMWDYPRALRPRVRDFDLFHVVDHSYAHLVHALPADRTGVYCHDLNAFRCILEPEKEPRPRWFRAMQRKVFEGMQKAAMVFYNTREIGRSIEALGLFDPSRLVYAPPGLSPEFLDAAIPDAPRPTELETLKGHPYLLHVGITVPRKRIDVLLDVFAEVHRRHPEMRLVQMGGVWTPAQREQLERLGLQNLAVQVQNLPRATVVAIYRGATLVLHPSDNEGFGLPLIEAMASGVPVVASDIPVLREAGGDAALYCPVGDVPRWVEVVDRVLSDPATAPTPEVRSAWVEQFSWRNYAGTVLEAYQRFIPR